MDETFVCEICGREYAADLRFVFDGQELCPACLEAETVICRECGVRIWQDDNAGSMEYPLCRDCYDEQFTNCVQCGTLLRLSSALYEDSDGDEDRPYCNSCYLRLPGDSIRDYSYKPEPIFYGEGARYFGVELEIDDGGELSGNAQSIMSAANQSSPLIYCKHDGSLDDGFEIVTHPMTLDYHLSRMPWQAVLDQAAEDCNVLLK